MTTPLNRRAFLGTALGTLGAAGGSAALLAACAGARAARTTTASTTTTTTTTAAAGAAAAGARVPGIQLYTVRTLMEQDVEGTLRALGALGYREVEFAGYFGRTPQALRATLDAAGLRAPSAHVPVQQLRAQLGPTLDAAAALGHRYLVNPFTAEAERTADGYRRLAAESNRVGEACRARGIQFGYHNHDFEFADLGGGRTGLDILIAETDPALVTIELDLFWATKAGRDPVAMFAAHPGRFQLCHVKDMRDPRGAQQMAPVGEGGIDFARIFAAGRQGGLRHFFVEHDNAAQYPGGPMASATKSYAALARLLA